MSLSRSLSLGVGVATTILVAATIAYLQRTGWADDDQVVLLGVAIVIGLMVMLVQSMVLNRLDLELRRLCTHIERLGRSDAPAPPYHAGTGGLRDLANAVDHSVGKLRRRIDTLMQQRRELEIHVRISEAQRRHAEAILNAISDGVIVTDAFNEVALANESAARLLQFDLRRAVRRPIERVVTHPVLVKLIKDMREAAASGAGTVRRNVEFHLDTHRGPGTFEVTLTSLNDQDDAAGAGHETAGIVTVLRDITREKEIAEMKSDFVSNVSHELRTPLACIKAYMEMLIDGEAQNEPARQEFYNIVQGEANRLTRLIENLLNISRIEAGVVRTQRELVSLSQVVSDVLDVMKPQARARRVELTCDTAPFYVQVFADRDMIYQALLNLVSNAIKYTPPGGVVEVELYCDRAHRQVEVRVRDTGVGVPPQDLPRLFDKFYRVADHKKLAAGTGLGLNLVKHIIETVHGGTVRVESDLDKGSVFTFSLPIAEYEY